MHFLRQKAIHISLAKLLWMSFAKKQDSNSLWNFVSYLSTWYSVFNRYFTDRHGYGGAIYDAHGPDRHRQNGSAADENVRGSGYWYDWRHWTHRHQGYIHTSNKGNFWNFFKSVFLREERMHTVNGYTERPCSYNAATWGVTIRICWRNKRILSIHVCNFSGNIDVNHEDLLIWKETEMTVQY